MPLYSIGHSTHAFDDFAALLARHEIAAVADIRSRPFSRFHPQFNRKTLAGALDTAGIAYHFLGEALGGRPDDPDCFTDGAPDYAKMARRPAFREGIARLLELARARRVAMMCAERDPLDCHRCLLVGRTLQEEGIAAAHILADGETVSQGALEERLLDASGLAGDDLIATRAERLDLACRKRLAGAARPKARRK